MKKIVLFSIFILSGVLLVASSGRGVFKTENRSSSKSLHESTGSNPNSSSISMWQSIKSAPERLYKFVYPESVAQSNSSVNISNITSPLNVKELKVGVTDRSAIVADGVARTTENSPVGVLASASKTSLGNSDKVLIDFKASKGKQDDAHKAIEDLSISLDVTDAFVTDLGRAADATLRQSVDLFSQVAKNELYRTSLERRDNAVVDLIKQRKDLGDSYQSLLSSLKETATRNQIKHAQAEVQKKISNKNLEELFKGSRSSLEYDEFVKKLTDQDIFNPRQLTDFLEQTLNISAGELSKPVISIQASMKLESLYQALDLIALKKGLNAENFTSINSMVNYLRGSRLPESNKIMTLMNGIKRIEPTVRTIYEQDLLGNPVNKELVLLLVQSDTTYSVIGRAIKELQLISFDTVADIAKQESIDIARPESQDGILLGNNQNMKQVVNSKKIDRRVYPDSVNYPTVPSLPFLY